MWMSTWNNQPATQQATVCEDAREEARSLHVRFYMQRARWPPKPPKGTAFDNHP